LLPVIFIGVFGVMFKGGDKGGEGGGRPIAVWFEPGDVRGADLAKMIDDSGAFAVVAKDSADAVRAAVADEDPPVGLIIPRDFDPTAARPAELVIDEASSPIFRGPIEGAMKGILARAFFGAMFGGLGGPGGAAASEPQVLVVKSPPGIDKPMENMSSFQVSVPGNAVLFGFFLALTVALSFVEEKQSGTWRRIMAAPISRPAILVAKLVPYFLIGCAQMTVLFTIGALVFGMKIGGSLAALAALTAAVVLCATALGLLIASFGGTQKKIGSIGSICILVLGLLGGGMMPRVFMPEVMQTIGLATPHAWALDGYYDLLLRDGAGFSDVWRSIVMVLGFALLFGGIGAARFRFEK
jgi:ABC-type transport system involved in multi-copper enzyme maturation permease subunit